MRGASGHGGPRLLVFEVPLPPLGCGPNTSSSKSWRAQSRVRKLYRGEVRMEAASARNVAGWVCARRVRVALLFGTAAGERRRYWDHGAGRWKYMTDKRYRPVDRPNAVYAAKGLYDGLVDAELFEDDRGECMEDGGVEIDRGVGPWVRVTIEALGSRHEAVG